MLAPRIVLDFVKAEPFRPFRLRMASGRTFEIRHQKMVKVQDRWYVDLTDSVKMGAAAP